MDILQILLSALILAALAGLVTLCTNRNRQDADSCAGDCANCLKHCEDRQGRM